MNREKIIILCDISIEVCLCLMIFCLPFSKAAIETFVWLALVLWLAKRMAGYKSESLKATIPSSDLNAALGIYLGVVLLSVLFSQYGGLSMKAFLGKQLKFVLLYIMLVEVFNSVKRLKRLLAAVAASIFMIIIDAGVQYFTGTDFLRGYRWSRLTASFISANTFACWLTVMILLLSGAFLEDKLLDKKFRHPLPVTVVLLMVCLLMTYARGAWLGLLTGGALMSYYILKRSTVKIKIRFLSSLVCLAAVFLFVSKPLNTKMREVGKVNFDSAQTVSERVKSIVQFKGGAFEYRMGLWREALRIIRDYPVLGAGLNTYTIMGRRYKSFEGGGIYPHNSLLQMTAEIGVMGILAFFYVIAILFRRGFEMMNTRKNFFLIGLLGAIAGLLVHSVFDTVLFSLQLAVLFWTILGMAGAVMKLEKTPV